MSSDEEETYEEDEEERSQESEKEDEDYEPETDEGSANGSSSSEGEEENDPQSSSIVLKPKNVKKRKRDVKDDGKKINKKAKTMKNENVVQIGLVDGGENNFTKKSTSHTDKKSTKSVKKDDTLQKKESPLFNDKNADLNLFLDAPENVIPRKVKLSSNILLSCKMISPEGKNNTLNFDYAAMIFHRKIKEDKSFEFNLPLSLAPKIIEGIQFLIKENPNFFAKK